MTEVYLVCAVDREGAQAPHGVFTTLTLAKAKAEEIWFYQVEAVITSWHLNGQRGRGTWVRDEKGLRHY